MSTHERLVRLAHSRAEKKHGDARHLLSRETWEALVKAEALDIAAAQVADDPMACFAREVMASFDEKTK